MMQEGALTSFATGCRKKKIFFQISQQSLGISKRNFTNIFNHPMRT